MGEKSFYIRIDKSKPYTSGYSIQPTFFHSIKAIGKSF